MNEQYHPIQRGILNKLLFSPRLNFASLKPLEMEGSQFTFHLNKLLESNLIEKSDEGKYFLTGKGKNIANIYDPESQLPNKQAKHSAVFCATRNNKQEILIYRRLKEPFFGCQGFPTGKVKYGENILDTAVRELFEETNLVGEPILRAIRHFKVYESETKQLLEDKVMYICEIPDPIGELHSNNEREFQWVKTNEVKTVITNPLEEFEETLSVIMSSEILTFKEVDQYTSKF
jgi:ADP-ribose pyrophosphatase YjhB (NUDIX family)